MRKNRIILGTLALAAALTLAPASGLLAEQLSIPVGSQADREFVSTPETGMSQDAVRATWGEPLEVMGPVGEPPITQWHYRNFIVYFEHDRVLHAVLKPNR
ncbi:outer membrane protein assembly factor BamE [Marinobacter sp. M216]|uniref:Outer membrane protein assembly factor BamE n=1 Tax=Marinobacter albus TaxID=3030833 RepID=A0ABT7HC46_9GAMM|nr:MULTISPECIES: outer membrane protein assembly factor BamE [unclassified Marinobacter]MBW7470152.1 outer membrane protein assembly factor BamE [Marinobacter sp. F4218]MDK9557584.1 outer membrane protein assembly factor BamE [Marinobacter sp. M216]